MSVVVAGVPSRARDDRQLRWTGWDINGCTPAVGKWWLRIWYWRNRSLFATRSWEEVVWCFEGQGGSWRWVVIAVTVSTLLGPRWMASNGHKIIARIKPDQTKPDQILSATR
jgi:hypothetical protein